MKKFKKLSSLVLSSVLFLGSAAYTAPVVHAAGFNGVLTSVENVEVDGNTATVTYNDGVQGKITFLEEGIFRFNVDPSGKFSKYATPRSSDHTAKIQAQPDESDNYTKPNAKVAENGNEFVVSTGTTNIHFEKATGKMTVKSGDKVVLNEKQSLTIQSSGTVQTLDADANEYFFGGGTQNGRFSHKGEVIDIVNQSGWTDGLVSSPNPFYWSSKGYGVLRNTFAQGKYNFGNTKADTVTATHNEPEFDAYYFVSGADNTAATSQELLQDYFKVTGNPALLPEYGFYEGHLNCYNRDAWSDTEKAGYRKWVTTNPDGSELVQYERGGTGTAVSENEQLESLVGEEPTKYTNNIPKGVTNPEQFSAKKVLDRYFENDMPLGYFLPNDGYGCGYGQNGYNMTGGVNEDGTSSADRTAAVDANVANLAKLTEYANSKGVATGLWTQSMLEPTKDNSTQWHLLRDFKKEVKTGGVTTLKTDVAWVGHGYSMQLDGVKTAYDIMTTEVGARPNIISLDGWAGSQRFNSVWTGDQYGGNWEYIRFHIPTYIGQGLAGNPNIGSDMDGIFGGAPLIATRDYQWKAFTPQMLNMDGWGSYFKGPHAFNDPYKSTARMYLKKKAELMAYIYTTAASASNIDTGNGDTGLPMMRAMFLEYPDDPYAYSKKMQYQFMFGDSFLVAPIYQNTKADAEGNDIRNDIYLPKGETWVDYFTGKQYRGGTVINNFDAPLWKLPLFVKNGSIVPMYEENNTPDEINKANRIVEFWPEGNTDYTAFEDDGKSITNQTEEDKDYGVIDNISYGGHVSTKYTSKVDGETATLTAEKSTGTYDGYKKDKNTTFVVNVSQEPESIEARNGADKLSVVTAESKADFDKKEVGANEVLYFYDESPVIKTYANDSETRIAEMVKDVKVAPKLYVKFAKTDAKANVQTLVINGFVNDGNLPEDKVTDTLTIPTNFTASEITPYSVSLGWDAVENATSYDIEADGIVYSLNPVNSYTHTGLSFLEDHAYRVRAVNKEGHSEWTEVLNVTTADDPYRNVPKGMSVKYDYGTTPAAYAGKLEDMVDGNDTSEYSSRDAGVWTGKSFTIDMKKIYSIEKLDYAFRENGGNGAIHTLGVEYSIDGETWSDYGEINLTPFSQWEKGSKGTENPNARYATINFDKILKARYLRIKTIKTTGGFLQAYEFRPYHIDGEVGIIPGDLDFNDTVNGNDEVWLLNHHPEAAGSRIGEAAYESDPVKAGLRDLNGNGMFDAFDISLMSTQMNGGIKEEFDASGNLAVLPSKQQVKAGETFTVDVYGANLTNVHAFDFELSFAKGDIVTEKQTDVTVLPYVKNSHQRVYSYVHKTDANDRIYATLSNLGAQPLLNGNIKVATVTLTAAKDLDLSNLQATAGLLVGSSLNTVKAFETTKPEVPEETAHVLTLDDMTITSEEADPLQSNMGPDKLVDGKVGEDAYRYEFRWGDSQETVVAQLPHEILYEFNTPQKLSELRIQLRNSGGSLNQGALKDFDLIGIVGDTETEIGSYTMTSPDQTFDLGNGTYDAVKLVCKTSQAGIAYKLNIDETSFVVNNAIVPTGIEFDSENPTTLYIGQLTAFVANVLPADASNKLYTMTSDNDAVRVITSSNTTGYHYSLLALEPGAEANITVTSLANEKFSATTKVKVSEKAYTTDLEAVIARAESLSGNLYTEASYGVLIAKIEAAKVALNGSQNDVDTAESNLLSAIAALEFKGSDNSRPDSENHIDETGMKVVFATSEATGDGDVKEHVIDNDPNSIWHSSYQSGAALPVHVVVDLGKVYSLEQVNYLARQNSPNGHITHYRVEVSHDGNTFVPVVEGLLPHNGYELNDKEQYKKIKFAPVEARFVKFVALEGLSTGGIQDRYASVAELDFFGVSNEKVPAESITLDKEEATMTVGDTMKLVATLTPENTTDTVVWTSSNEKVATVDAEGNVSAIAAGSAEITATINGLTAKAVITVKAKEVVDKTALSIAVEEAEAVSEEQLDKVVPVVAEEFRKALAEAKTILADENATQVDVDASFTRLASVIQMLDFVKGDKTDLQALVDAIAELNKEDFTADSWKALEEALKEAKDVIADENALEKEVVDAYNKLNEAFTSLEHRADKARLQALVDKMNGLDESKYIKSTWDAMVVTLTQAQKVLDNKEATQAEVDAAYEGLLRGYLGLRFVPDKGMLEDLINKVENLTAQDFTEASWDALATALKEAKEVNANEKATAKEIETAYEALYEAYAGLDKVDVTKPGDNGSDNETNHGTGNGTNTGDTSNRAAMTGLMLLAGAVLVAKKEKFLNSKVNFIKRN